MRCKTLMTVGYWSFVSTCSQYGTNKLIVKRNILSCPTTLRQRWSNSILLTFKLKNLPARVSSLSELSTHQDWSADVDLLVSFIQTPPAANNQNPYNRNAKNYIQDRANLKISWLRSLQIHVPIHSSITNLTMCNKNSFQISLLLYFKSIKGLSPHLPKTSKCFINKLKHQNYHTKPDPFIKINSGKKNRHALSATHDLYSQNFHINWMPLAHQTLELEFWTSSSEFYGIQDLMNHEIT